MEDPVAEGSLITGGVGVKLGGMGFGLGLDEIHGIIAVTPGTENTLFTAPLELPPPGAVELLVKKDITNEAIPPPFCPSKASLIDHATKFSVFTSTDASLESTTIMSALGSMKVEIVKQEALDSNSWPEGSSPAVSNQSLNPSKRKRREKQANESNKKEGKPGENERNVGSGEELPYVHVRARRGQATDSHSLAERARREKINARMKLLQELVPGCNKISGTALVLDEIINHVQALQRQVEFLSMRLAAVADPRTDFNLDCFLAATESGTSVDTSHPGLFAPPIWPDNQMDFIRQHPYQQPSQFNVQHQPSWGREEDPAASFLATEDFPPRYSSPLNSTFRHSGRLKVEL